jgi:hypothetical protein
LEEIIKREKNLVKNYLCFIMYVMSVMSVSCYFVQAIGQNFYGAWLFQFSAASLWAWKPPFAFWASLLFIIFLPVAGLPRASWKAFSAPVLLRWGQGASTAGFFRFH